MAAISWCGCKMADKRITDLPEAVTITVDKLVVLDSAADGTEKGTIGDIYEAMQAGLAAFGAIYVTEASASQSLTANTGAKLTLFDTDGESRNTTVSAADDQITVNEAGTYRVDSSFSMTSDTNNVTVLFHVALNGFRQEPGTPRKIGTGSDVGSCSTPSIFLDLAVDDILSIEVEADLNNNLTVIDGGLVANRIG